MSYIVQLESDYDVEEFIDQGGEILYFTAPWCQPCRAYGPTITKVATDTEVKVGKINADRVNKALSKYRIQAVPTLVKIASNGDAIKTARGLQTDDFVRSFIE